MLEERAEGMQEGKHRVFPAMHTATAVLAGEGGRGPGASFFIAILHSSFVIRHSSFVSVRLQPVGAPAAVGHEGHAHAEGLLHLGQDDGLHLFALL